MLVTNRCQYCLLRTFAARLRGSCWSPFFSTVEQLRLLRDSVRQHLTFRICSGSRVTLSMPCASRIDASSHTTSEESEGGIESKAVAMVHTCSNSWCDKGFEPERDLFYHSRVCRQRLWWGHARGITALEKDATPDIPVHTPPQVPLSHESLPSGADVAIPGVDLDMSTHPSRTLDEYDDQHLAHMEECHQTCARSTECTSDLTTQVMSVLMRTLSGDSQCS